MDILAIIIVVNFAFSICGLVMVVDLLRRRKKEMADKSQEITAEQLQQAIKEIEERKNTPEFQQDVNALLSSPDFVNNVVKAFER